MKFELGRFRQARNYLTRILTGIGIRKRNQYLKAKTKIKLPESENYLPESKDLLVPDTYT